MKTTHLSFATCGAVTCLWVLFLSLAGCSKNEQPTPEAGKPKQGHATGKVTDSQGNPIAGAKILLDNTMLYASYINATTGDDGTYSIKMPTGAYGIWKAYATITREYHGKTYTMDLHPDKTDSFNEEGAERSFTWKLTGKKPEDEFFYYGGSIRIGPAVGSIIPDNKNIVVIIEPDGPLIDGTIGEMLTIPYGDVKWQDPVEIKDIPIGRYKAIAVYHDEMGDYLLRLRNLETEGIFEEVLTFDFEPESRWGYDNTVSLEFHE